MWQRTSRVGPHVIQNECEHRQDRGLARTGREDRQYIDTVQQLHHSLDLMVPRHVGPDTLKDFTYECLPYF